MRMDTYNLRSFGVTCAPSAKKGTYGTAQGTPNVEEDEAARVRGRFDSVASGRQVRASQLRRIAP